MLLEIRQAAKTCRATCGKPYLYLITEPPCDQLFPFLDAILYIIIVLSDSKSLRWSGMVAFSEAWINFIRLITEKGFSSALAKTLNKQIPEISVQNFQANRNIRFVWNYCSAFFGICLKQGLLFVGSHNNNVFTPLLKSIRQNYISDVTVKIYIDRKKITMIKMNKKRLNWWKIHMGYLHS